MPAPATKSTLGSRARSRAVRSNQAWIHPALPALVRKHQRHPHRKPVAAYNRAAFDRLLRELERNPRPLVLDSYCGTGHSTAALAARHPGHLVVGIDKSAHRLARHPRSPGADYLLLHAECEPLWQLLAQRGCKLAAHYLLYPNPWPKSSHLKRRVHGHPGFSSLLSLGGNLELRSNWQLYAEEFGVALATAGYTPLVGQLRVEEPVSLFERKYRDSGHPLWVCRARI